MLGRWAENCETSTDRLRVTERASFANLLKPAKKKEKKRIHHINITKS